MTHSLGAIGTIGIVIVTWDAAALLLGGHYTRAVI